MSVAEPPQRKTTEPTAGREHRKRWMFSPSCTMRRLCPEHCGHRTACTRAVDRGLQELARANAKPEIFRIFRMFGTDHVMSARARP